MENLGSVVPGSTAESTIKEPNIPKQEKVKRTAPRDGVKAGEGKLTAEMSKQKLYEITLHDNDEVPPGGQRVGVNGVFYTIPAGVRCKVPKAVLEVLDNAVQSTPVLNERMQVVDTRSAPRLSYTLHHDGI